MSECRSVWIFKTSLDHFTKKITKISRWVTQLEIYNPNSCLVRQFCWCFRIVSLMCKNLWKKSFVKLIRFLIRFLIFFCFEKCIKMVCCLLFQNLAAQQRWTSMEEGLSEENDSVSSSRYALIVGIWNPACPDFKWYGKYISGLLMSSNINLVNLVRQPCLT